jgi:hypothetical protein
MYIVLLWQCSVFIEVAIYANSLKCINGGVICANCSHIWKLSISNVPPPPFVAFRIKCCFVSLQEDNAKCTWEEYRLYGDSVEIIAIGEMCLSVFIFHLRANDSTTDSNIRSECDWIKCITFVYSYNYDALLPTEEERKLRFLDNVCFVSNVSLGDISFR